MSGRTSHRRARVQHLLSLLVLSVFALTAFAVRAHAQIVGDLNVDIPFQFHAGNTKLPAGKYRIHMLDDSDLTVMEISSMDSSVSALFDVEDDQAQNTPAKSELIFNKYGDQYFLARVFDDGNPLGSKVVESRYEKKLSQQGATAQEHVPAQHTKRHS